MQDLRLTVWIVQSNGVEYRFVDLIQALAYYRELPSPLLIRAETAIESTRQLCEWEIASLLTSESHPCNIT